jgi:uncharacterized protein
METSIATRSNLQVIQQAFADFAQRNIPAIVNACADDVMFASYKIADVPTSGSFYGKEGVQEFFTKLEETILYSYFQPHEFIVQDDRVIVLGHQTGTVKSTGKTFDHDWCFSFKMNNGKLQHYFAFTDTNDQAKAFR